MNFELGKEYIVAVTDKGIVPIDEFDRERFYDKDNDDLDFLTDEEKTAVINDVLGKIRSEIEKIVQEETVIDSSGGEYERTISKLDPDDVFEIIDKYKTNKEEQQNIESCDIKKFRVGDIVFLNQNVKAGKGIIERISFDYGIKEEKAFVNFGRGSNGWYALRHLTNTGKHYPLINEILGEIQGEE